MKTTVSIIFSIICVLAFSRCTHHEAQQEAAFVGDTVATEDYIQKIHLSDPQRALLLLDTMEMKKAAPQFRIDLLRAQTYNGMRMRHLELIYWQKVLASDSIQASEAEALKIKSNMVSPYIEIGNYQKAMQIATEVAEKAHLSGNKQVESNMLLEIGRIYKEQKLPEQCDLYYDHAIDLLENSTDIRELAMLSYIYGQQMASYYEQYLFDQAIQTGEKREQLIDRMSKMQGAPDGYCDQQYGFLYSKLAAIYQENQQPQKAADAFKKYQVTSFSKMPNGRREAIPYLICSGHYKEAEACIPEKKLYGNDSINMTYAIDVDYRHEIALNRKDYQAAYTYALRKQAILDSLTERTNEATTLELATVYETAEKNLQIQEQQNELSIQRIIIISALGLLFLAGFICWLIIRSWRTTKRRNRAMAKQINELLVYKDKLQEAKEEIHNIKQPERKETHKIQETEESQREKAWFEELDSLICREKLFLDMDISREMLLKRTCIPKNLFAHIIQKYSDTNFSGYINSKRLDYSIHLLKDSQTYTVEAIAIDSGFGNVRSFYRIFREKYGMTPSEYRNTLEK